MDVAFEKLSVSQPIVEFLRSIHHTRYDEFVKEMLSIRHQVVRKWTIDRVGEMCEICFYTLPPTQIRIGYVENEIIMQVNQYDTAIGILHIFRLIGIPGKFECMPNLNLYDYARATRCIEYSVDGMFVPVDRCVYDDFSNDMLNMLSDQFSDSPICISLAE
jgi:hypothetical protein